jgi:hypothetical protein
MLSFQEAKAIVEELLLSLNDSKDENDWLIIVEQNIVEIPYAWIFPYDKKGSVPGDWRHFSGSNSPFFIDKKDGRVSQFSSGYFVDQMIDLYEEENKCWRLEITPDTYTSGRKRRSLEDHLQLMHKDVFRMKVGGITILDSGSKKRLDEMAAILNEDGIETSVTLREIPVN